MMRQQGRIKGGRRRKVLEEQEEGKRREGEERETKIERKGNKEREDRGNMQKKEGGKRA